MTSFHVDRRTVIDPVEELLKYWSFICLDRPMPARSDVDPQTMPRQLLPHIIMIGVHRDPVDFTYRLMGTKVTPHMKRDYTGERLSNLEHQKQGSRVWQTLLNVLECKRPVKSEIPYVGPHRDFLDVRDVLCPLSDNGSHVDHVIAAVHFRSKSPTPKRRRGDNGLTQRAH